ncbi:MAG TPA: CHAT domain-containing protein [Pyrinomonadaceae bacterium]|jgi:CHAT domain-containing protein/tetratricopeptide (TPR) repeat protein
MRPALRLLAVLLVLSSCSFVARAQTATPAPTPTPEAAFADALVAAPTEAERDALLAQQPALVTVELLHQLKQRGRRFFDQQDYARALAVHTFNLRLAERLDSKPDIGGALNGIALAYQGYGDYPRALEYLHRSLNYIDPADKESLGIGHFNVALSHQFLGDFDEALAGFGRALALFRELNAPPRVARTLKGFADVYMLRGDYTTALDYYGQTLAIYQAAGSKWGEAETLSNVGSLYSSQGNYALAVSQHQRSLALFREVGDKSGQARALTNLGETYAGQGADDAALDCYQQSLAIFEALGEQVGRGAALNNLGNVYGRRGDHARALEHFQRALALFQEAGVKHYAGATLNGMAESYRALGDTARAVEHADRAAALAREVGAAGSLAEARTTAGAALRAAGRTDEARRALEEAVAAVESVRARVAGGAQERAQFFEHKLAPYRELVSLHVAARRDADALGAAERAKARVLLEVLGGGRDESDKVLTTAEREREQSLLATLASLNAQLAQAGKRARPDTTRLAALRAELDKARLEREAFAGALYAAHPELRVRRGEAAPFRLTEAGALLPDANAALLEYVVADDSTYLFVVTRDANGALQLQTYTLAVKRAELAARAERLRAAAAGRDLTIKEQAAGLYRLLLAPAEAQLRGRRALVVVPDDVLWNLPFQVLTTPQGHYLLEDAALSYAPSLTVLREMRAARRRQHARPPAAELMAVGNPAPGDAAGTSATGTAAHTSGGTNARADVLLADEFAPLPDAERQVRALRALYGAGGAHVLLGAEASEEQVKAQAHAYRTLHFVTHGVLDDQNPMYSYVRLAAGGRDDGRLEAWELMKLDLRADMVVLAACETARGRVGAGEGVIGLSWALFVAGSPIAVVSQWRVDSAATTDLMLEFHRDLKPAPHAQTPPPARALQQAALKLLRDGRHTHPFYWAGFVAVGDAQ